MIISLLEQNLCHRLRNFPREFNNRYTVEAHRRLIELLFRSLVGHKSEYLRLFFPHGPPTDPKEVWTLRNAQGAVEGAEYTEAARGHPCGHIFKSGEATYRCKTCTVDDTCVLCARCFDASDHEGHTVFVSISPGNSGCCDCGDPEAWVRPVYCNIHTALTDVGSKAAGKAKEGSMLPDDLLTSIRSTISRTLDYLCDVFSCSPEQLRLPKTEQSIRDDERLSRLTSRWYAGLDIDEEDREFALILWNDEKHTVNDLRDQVARACKKRKSFGLAKAHEVNDIGRSVVVYDTDVNDLLRMAKIIEEIKLTVTIRSSRDTFREQMCGAIIEWIHDIAGCSVGADGNILRSTICEEMLKPWRMGSEAHHAQIGKDGIDDHETEEAEEELRYYSRIPFLGRRMMARRPVANEGEDNQEEEWYDEEEEHDADDDSMDLDDTNNQDGDGDIDMDVSDEPEDSLEASEATYAGYPPPPPPPPPPPVPRRREHDHTPADSDGESFHFSQTSLPEPIPEVPKTPRAKSKPVRPPRPPRYWLEKPEGYGRKSGLPVYEDLWQRVRLDHMILYDLRMWKKVRVDIRDVFISTVVTIPYFKRVLGLRFAGLYTMLAQLYLIADREPDHSIINLSLQMLTTPSITAEVVERGNFLTNLMAILYTFLTTRQVGYPSDVNPRATLAFEAGAVTNRRMYHFFLDMKYLLNSEHIQEKLCYEDRYLMQFLDLVKLHQGICPNIRAVGEHLEYETDAWISASIITREINRLCRQFSEAFTWTRDQDATNICRAIRRTGKVVIISSLGAERKRFDQAEIKTETRFKTLEPFQFDYDASGYPQKRYTIVDFVVEKEPMSFHHALHYTLSWLIDRGKSMTYKQLLGLLLYPVQELREPPVPRASIPAHRPEEYLLALFDYPLRVCAWLAQMRAGMWVRNGITLRHQMSTYRGVMQRDVSYQRDLFLLQVAIVLCNPATFLATMIERFGMSHWVRGEYDPRPGWEDHQTVDVAEDFVHLLIILLSDRLSLLPLEDEPKPQLLAMRRDIAHILCFKPLSYSDIVARVTDKVGDSDELAEVLEHMTHFKPPEGLSDSGTFELRNHFIEEIDPFIATYSRNQREEADNVYRNYISKKTGKPASEIVFEPKLRTIPSGVFKDLAAFTRTALFAQLIYNFLGYALAAPIATPNIPTSRVEGFIQFSLQLVLIAVNEDKAGEDGPMDEPPESFISYLLRKRAHNRSHTKHTIFELLHEISILESFKSCEPKIRLIFHRLRQKRPQMFTSALTELNISPDRLETASPASLPQTERELKKKQALERQARIMAQMREQQTNFMQNAAFDWGEDNFSDLEDEMEPSMAEQEKVWKYPDGTCILCQEETNDQRLYGTFALFTESSILRQTDLKDEDWVEEVTTTPISLDRSADHIRPFGVAGKNRHVVQKVTAGGDIFSTERQGLGKGFPRAQAKRGPVTIGCGHIMHYHCFEAYGQATQRRHTGQIARNHPERPELKEFLCPLCKALGNAFLPIIWKGKTLSYPGVLKPEPTFDQWLGSQLAMQISKLHKGPERPDIPGLEPPIGSHFPSHPLEPPPLGPAGHHRQMFYDYSSREFIPSLASKLPELTRSNYIVLPPIAAPQPSHRLQLPSFVALPLPPEEVRIQEPPVLQPDPSRPSVQQTMPTIELYRVYQRLRDTMRANSLPSRFVYQHSPNTIIEDLTYTDTLARSLGYSISAVEIQQRGVESEYGCTLLDKISQQSLTHLRVLSETVSSYLAIGGLRGEKTCREFHGTQERQMLQLFTGHPQVFDRSSLMFDVKGVPSLLTQDSFIFFCEAAVCLVPVLHLEIHHVLRLCYLAEIVRVIMAFLVSEPDAVGQRATHPDAAEQIARLANSEKYGQTLEEMQNFEEFVDRLLGIACDGTVASFPGFRSVEEINRVHFTTAASEPDLKFIYTLVASYVLPFLRKVLILMHVRFGVEFPQNGLGSYDEPESKRLTRVLMLPSLNDLFVEFNAHTPSGTILREVVAGWIQHWTWSREGKRQHRPLLSLSHPAIFELVGLPKNYDILTDEAIRRRCPTTGKELTDPCVCLFCGEIFCSQAVCCMNDMEQGGCNQHQMKCGGNIGLFINIRKCMVLFLNLTHGTWTVAPYLDKHGEVDPTLRRHHQLFLNQRRYDALLRNVWLAHGIPSTIGRKLDADINNGGWETL